MVQSKGGGVARELGTLWSTGTLTGATDAQLLQRFTLDRDATAELAFRELLERHAPMVIGVCRQIVRRQQDVDDAFQATFLVLVRKARSIQVARIARSMALQGCLPNGSTGEGFGFTARVNRAGRRRSGRFGWGRRMLARGRARSPRRDRPSAGKVPVAHRALPPRRQVTRRGRSRAELADRNAQRPALTRPCPAERQTGAGGLAVPMAAISPPCS